MLKQLSIVPDEGNIGSGQGIQRKPLRRVSVQRPPQINPDNGEILNTNRSRGEPPIFKLSNPKQYQVSELPGKNNYKHYNRSNTPPSTGTNWEYHRNHVLGIYK